MERCQHVNGYHLPRHCMQPTKQGKKRFEAYLGRMTTNYRICSKAQKLPSRGAGSTKRTTSPKGARSTEKTTPTRGAAY